MSFTNTTSEYDHVVINATDEISAIPFPVRATSDIQVLNVTTGVTATVTTDYTITGGGALAGSGGFDTIVITLVDAGAWTTGDTVRISRVTPAAQEYDFANHDSFQGTDLESALDKCYMALNERRSQFVGAYRTEEIRPGDITVPTNNGCSSRATEELAPPPGGLMVNGYDFAGDSNEYLQFVWTSKIEWDAGPVKLRFFWTPQTVNSSDTVIFQVACGAHGDGADLTGSGHVTFSAPYLGAVTDTCQGNDTLHLATTNAFTPEFTPAPGELIYFIVRRLAITDTYADDARLIRIQLQYLESSSNPSIIS